MTASAGAVSPRILLELDDLEGIESWSVGLGVFCLKAPSVRAFFRSPQDLSLLKSFLSHLSAFSPENFGPRQ